LIGLGLIPAGIGDPLVLCGFIQFKMMDNYSESDEAFARRLQAQEMGNFTSHGHTQADAQTPLVVRLPADCQHN
jgi:hypothetical protein